MGESLSFNQFQECINRIRILDDKIQDIEYEIRHTVLCVDSCLQNLSITKFSINMNEYIEGIHKMHEDMEDCVNELKRIEKICSQEASPLFDFIVSFDIGTWWKQAYPVIEQIATVTGAITGVAAITTTPLVFIKWMRGKLQERKNKDEYTWVKLILNSEEWTVSSLSEKLDLSEDDTKKMLKGFGYKWNPQKMLYVSTESTQKLRDIDVREIIL